ncbi:hypothetical protein SDC9_118139 [bioreactor metagenome]|uniref:Uncharacterized protein n=1 Tax=bioreactor metagenome TaxID=1076179 RepID=A0A645C024_9ZZZZ
MFAEVSPTDSCFAMLFRILRGRTMLVFKVLHAIVLATAHRTSSSTIAAKKYIKCAVERLPEAYTPYIVIRLSKEIKTVSILTMPKPIASLL